MFSVGGTSHRGTYASRYGVPHRFKILVMALAEMQGMECVMAGVIEALIRPLTPGRPTYDAFYGTLTLIIVARVPLLQ